MGFRFCAGGKSFKYRKTKNQFGLDARKVLSCPDGFLPEVHDIARQFGEGAAAQMSDCASTPHTRCCEFKEGQRILLDGNIFEWSWVNRQTGTLRVTNGRSDYPTTHIPLVDLTDTNEIWRHATEGQQTANRKPQTANRSDRKAAYRDLSNKQKPSFVYSYRCSRT